MNRLGPEGSAERGDRPAPNPGLVPPEPFVPLIRGAHAYRQHTGLLGVRGSFAMTPHELMARVSTAGLCEWRPDRDPHAYSTSTIGRAKCPSGCPGWDEDRDGPLTLLVGAMARTEIEAMR